MLQFAASGFAFIFAALPCCYCQSCFFWKVLNVLTALFSLTLQVVLRVIPCYFALKCLCACRGCSRRCSSIKASHCLLRSHHVSVVDHIVDKWYSPFVTWMQDIERLSCCLADPALKCVPTSSPAGIASSARTCAILPADDVSIGFWLDTFLWEYFVLLLLFFVRKERRPPGLALLHPPACLFCNCWGICLVTSRSACRPPFVDVLCFFVYSSPDCFSIKVWQVSCWRLWLISS